MKREGESDDDGDKAREIFVVVPLSSPLSLLLMEDPTPESEEEPSEQGKVPLSLSSSTTTRSVFRPSVPWALLPFFLFIIFLGPDE